MKHVQLPVASVARLASLMASVWFAFTRAARLYGALRFSIHRLGFGALA